jgi:hypothetical protein
MQGVERTDLPKKLSRQKDWVVFTNTAGS